MVNFNPVARERARLGTVHGTKKNKNRIVTVAYTVGY
jgi:hypothetical protein